MASKTSMESLDRSIRASRKNAPAWSIRQKVEMISGGNVPSWVNSIPGPKYYVETDKFKHRSPVYSIGHSSRVQGSALEMARSSSEAGALPSMEQMKKGERLTSMIPRPPAYSIFHGSQDLTATRGRNFFGRIEKEALLAQRTLAGNSYPTGWLSLDHQLVQVNAQLPESARRRDAPELVKEQRRRAPARPLGSAGMQALESAGPKHSRSEPQMMTETQTWRLGNLL